MAPPHTSTFPPKASLQLQDTTNQSATGIDLSQLPGGNLSALYSHPPPPPSPPPAASASAQPAAAAAALRGNTDLSTTASASASNYSDVIGGMLRGAGGGGAGMMKDTNQSSTIKLTTGQEETSSTPLPGFINVRNISFDEVPYMGGMEQGLNGAGGGDYWYNLTTDCAGLVGGGPGWNGTTPSGCWNINTTDNSSVGPAYGSEPKLYWCLLLLIFPLFTVFGNSLVVMSVYKEKTLRTVTNYFIVSLALADIMVAALVMPLAVYVEVNRQWGLGDALCDTWVAFDVMCCTASILNLTAISVDRFIAVTQPIKYAKHKNSNRVYVTLALTWVISIAISSPIALGMNYTERRAQTPWLCSFYNSDFLIYSSMGSFYIPCVIMILLYWRIFRAIRQRSRKAAMYKKKKKKVDTKTKERVIENRAQVNKATSTDASATEDGCRRELLPTGNSSHLPATKGATGTSGSGPAHMTIAEETSFTNMNVKFSGTEGDTGDENNGQMRRALLVKSGTSDTENGAHLMTHDKTTDYMLTATSDGGEFSDTHSKSETGYCAPSAVQVEVSPVSTTERSSSPHPHTCPPELLSPPPKRSFMHSGFKNHAARPVKPSSSQNHDKNSESPKKSITKFNFRIRHSKKNKKETQMQRITNKRERKATQTLAIVLGVFLLCWVPFFTINIMNAICIRYNLFEKSMCQIDAMMFSFFVWLGYINSFLNPVIYTIFNIEFRRAFKKLLERPCR